MSYTDPQKFSRIFPKTFAYLKLVVPMMYLNMVNNPLPDVKVVLRQSDSSMKNEPAFFDPTKKVIVVALDEMLQFSSSLDIKRINPFESDVNMEKLLKYIDSMPKLSGILIHEYTHLIQSNTAFLRILRYSKTDLAEKMEYKQMPLYKECAGSLIGFFDRKYGIRHLFKEYGLSPTEIEARLAQWIFYKIHNYDTYTISCFDILFPKKMNFSEIDSKLKSIREGISSQQEEINLLKKNYLKNIVKIVGVKKKIQTLKDKEYFYKILSDYYPKMNKEAEAIAAKFRENYVEYIKELEKRQ